MKHWFTIQNAATAGAPAEISIHDYIGSYGVSAKDFLSQLAGLKASGATKINLSINSPGGSVFDGFAIYNGLKASGMEITTTIMGIAASMGSVIAMAGKKINMPANTMMMIHNASGGVMGNAADMRDVADVLDKIDNNIVAVYVARTGKPEDEVRQMMAAETFMTAAEALDLGFTDSVGADIKANAAFDLDSLPENVRALFTAAAAPKPKAKPAPAKKDDPDADDPDEDDPDVDDPEKSETAFADTVASMCAAAGMEAYAAAWALKNTDIKAVETAISAAREVTALCNLAKLPDLSASYIIAGKPIAEVRVDLAAKLADADEKTTTDTAPKGSKTSSSEPGAQPKAINTGSIWEARRKQQQPTR